MKKDPAVIFQKNRSRNSRFEIERRKQGQVFFS